MTIIVIFYYYFYYYSFYNIYQPPALKDEEVRAFILVLMSSISWLNILKHYLTWQGV